MERHDAAIIGAGLEGLVAAIVLARAKRRVILLERRGRMGGRAETCEFHPGFKASPYADELSAISSRLFRALDLARQGALLVPAPASVCISDEGTSVVFADEARTARAISSPSRAGFLMLRREVESVQRALDARALELPAHKTRRWFEFWKKWPRAAPWPGEDWAAASLDEMLRSRISDPVLRLHVAADAVSGRAVSPFLAGTALHLLAPGTGRSGMAVGGLGSIGAALMMVAANAGVAIRCGVEVQSIRSKRGRAVGLQLAGGEIIEARAVLSTLDVKRTFFGLAARDCLPAEATARLSRFRMAGQAARVLIALDAVPDFALPLADPDICLGPIHVVASLEAISRAHDSWREGVLPEAPLVTLRVPSLVDPRLCPAGKAVMTATISAVAGRLSDGPWTAAKREHLAQIALTAAERVLPGVSQHVLAGRTVIAPDVETGLGLTCGDLDGGELAPDQALSFRPFGEGSSAWTSLWLDGRTPVNGLYLGGPSSAPSPFLLGVSGERAAMAMLADLEKIDKEQQSE
jgi:phytoene dehydrogenase-like protein